jgi:uncharacterized repeat protein (TIGR03803 family)
MILSALRRLKLCSLGLLILGAAIESPAQTYKVLDNFGANNALVQGFGGYLFGPGDALGPKGQYGYGGSIFRMTPAGAATTIYTFCSQPNCSDGQDVSGIVVGTDGNIYGVTLLGGANSSIDCSGETVQRCGTVFKLTPGGVLTTLYNFCSQPNCADGSLPGAALVQGFDGNFYGTTGYGGTGTCPYYDGLQPFGCGTIFKITPEGALTTLYNFCAVSCENGYDPLGSLIQAMDGNLYGTTNFGGTGTGGPECGTGCGTIFQITPAGALTSLYSFCIQTGCPDGAGPESLMQAADGVFFGMTGGGGANNYGTVFAFTTSNVLTTMHSFCAQTNCTDGGYPQVALIQASDGNLYGSTTSGGSNSGGTLFKITQAGAFTTLYNLCAQTDCFDGISPNTPLFQYTDGVLYGAAGGGNPGNGVVYSLSDALPRFLTALPTLGRAGRKVTILGTGLTGATAVTFGGTAAAFTVVSSTEITATVPAAATTGRVKVTTPSGTFSTIDYFLVP